MLQTPIGLIALLLAGLVCGLTALVGSRLERIAALITLAAVAASLAVGRASPAGGWIVALAVTDVLVLLILIRLAWRPRRNWPVWAVGFQGLTVALDVLRVVDEGMAPSTYLKAVGLSTCGLVGVIAYAGWVAWRRRAHR